MAEILQKDLDRHLKSAAAKGFAPIYLIHGAEALVKSALDRLVSAILPDANRGFNVETIPDDSVPAALGQVNTYSFTPGARVVVLPDSRIFMTRQDHGLLAQKAAEAWNDKNPAQAARFFLGFLGAAGVGLAEAAAPETIRKHAALADAVADGDQWLGEIIRFCQEKNLAPRPPEDHTQQLKAAVEAGFPEGHHLMITTDLVDKRWALYKSIASAGAVIDCSVPTGTRKADRMAQDAVLRERADRVMAETGKKLPPAAFKAMVDRIGFDPRTFTAGLEKLADYVGDRPVITPQDVAAILSRTRTDPIFELTDAVAQRKTVEAFLALNSLLDSGFSGFPILAAVANQIRRLLVMKAFLESPAGSVWRPGMTYDRFQEAVMPAIRDHDESLTQTMAEWDAAASGAGASTGVDASTMDGGSSRADRSTKADGSTGGKAPGKARSSSKTGSSGKAGSSGKSESSGKAGASTTDLTILRGGKSPYPVFLLAQRAANYPIDRLRSALSILGEADVAMKSTGQPQARILEIALLRIMTDGPAN